MQRALLFTPLALATLIALSAACGGSSSETPWPVEPAPSMLAPPPDVVPLAEDDAGPRKRKE